MKLLNVLLFSVLILTCQAQPTVKYSSTDIQIAINRLNALGSFLYIAAHPDDENQGILTYMARGRLFQSAYLSLTRGDGGQNLLGPEKGDLLGVLRTQELLEARRIDGASQYFSRAVDFGYSKSAEESLQKWDHNLLLADVVRVIRQTRPDVIATRFSEHRGGHGHHISSAILAKEAFIAAADPEKFPEQLADLQPWQPKRLLWNTWLPRDISNETPVISLDLGEYNAVLGQSYREIAAKSRTMHKSQGFGSSPDRGHSLEYFQHTAGVAAEKDLFEDIDSSWKRVPGSAVIQEKVNQIIKHFNPGNPQASMADLVALYKLLDAKERSYWIDIKKKEVRDLLQMCSGLWIEAVAQQEAVSPGDSLRVTTSLLNRSDFKITLQKTQLTFGVDSLFDMPLQNGIVKTGSSNIYIPQTTPYSQPYWLRNSASETMFNVDEDFSGLPVEKALIRYRVTLAFDGMPVNYEIPVLYKWNDPVNGEQYKALYIQPVISISLDQNAYIFSDNKTKSVAVNIVANKDNLSGEVEIDVPPGWQKEPLTQHFSLQKINQQQTVEFFISPSAKAQNGSVTARARINGKKYSLQLVRVSYDHITQQNILLDTQAKLIKLEIIVPDKKIAYIMGSGDEIPQSLREIGLTVDLISDADLKSVDYHDYDAVICGVRAFNTRDDLALYQKRLLDYVKEGGVWIVQHNTRFGSQVSQIGPYPYEARGRSRISEEDTAVEILEPLHPLLNYPNKISRYDFENWVQERGTYMAETWDDHFVPLLAGHDTGEDPQKGGLLYSKYGKGTFIFTGLAWFRQLPEGVAGAYRIFVNMICAGDNNS